MRDQSRRTRIDINSVYQLESTLHVAHFLLSCLNKGVDSGFIDPVSGHIARSVSRLARFETVLLAWTACRYKELQEISLPVVLSFASFHIRQYKTGSDRVIDPLPCIDLRAASRLNPNIRTRYLTYDALSDAITRVVPRAVRECLLKNNTGTHVFRHLRASWMIYRGFNLSEVAAYFGHKSPATAEQYIHSSLVEIFHNKF